MFENRWRVSNPGVKYRKNPIYKIQDIKIINNEDIPKGVKPAEYSSLVDPDFVGKLVIVYDNDSIGCSGGNARWCYVYDCNCRTLKYLGTAIHKCVDCDYPEQNYNEKLYSILSSFVFNPDNIRYPRIDLVRNLEWPEDMPAVLSYNICQRENDEKLEEMISMEMVAFNKLERQQIKNDRIPLDTILQSVKIQIMKKVGYERKRINSKIEDAIIDLKLKIQEEPSKKEEFENKVQLLSLIKENIDTINKDSTMENFLAQISSVAGRQITMSEILDVNLGNMNLAEALRSIKKVYIEKEENYKEVEKSIIQTTVIDLMTNNTDRHLNNWALIRNKKTDWYILGIFDHATSFFNMATRTENPFLSQQYLKENWASSSVLLGDKVDERTRSTSGIKLFKYIMDNYREYVIEILQRLNNVLPNFENTISYESIPNSEFENISEDEQSQYYKSDMDMVVVPSKAIKGLKSKFRRIEQDYDITFGENQKIL